jgi:hypothetical protein
VSPPLFFACCWAIAATATAMLPMRYQIVPGLALLISAPVLLVWIGSVHGLWITLAALLAFLSMFRNPLIYLARRALGQKIERPDPRSRP